MSAPPVGWQPVIGLEVHAQLLTRSKLFCSAPVAPSAMPTPNQHVQPLCLGLPGALPRLNAEALRLAARAGLALGCALEPRPQFARKCYLYPDLPKGYQTSQADAPLCRGGAIPYLRGETPAELPLERIHLEEDAGRSLHRPADRLTLVDLDRAGVPLIEIVSLPALHTAEDAVAAFAELRLILLHLGVCDGALEAGSMRCDANVSVRRQGETALRTRCEIKNLNSLRALRDAIGYEVARQIQAWEAGAGVVQQTRLWDADAGKTRPMRDKEEAADYRYAPDPDLPIVALDPATVASWRRTQPVGVSQTRARLAEAGLDADARASLLEVPALCAALLDDAPPDGLDRRSLASFLLGPVLGQLKRDDRGLDAVPALWPALVEVALAWRRGALSNQLMAEVLRRGLADATEPTVDTLRAALMAVGTIDGDDATLVAALHAVVDAHPRELGQLRDGKGQLVGFFVGQTMRRLGGRADARRITALLQELVRER